MSAWGFHSVSGVDFFLEWGKIPPLCPVAIPSVLCPHRTQGIPKRLGFKTDRVYLSSARPQIENVEWDDDVFYYGTKSFKKIEEACRMTQEYVPLVIHNLKHYDKCDEVFRRALAIVVENKRPIIFVSEDVDWIVKPEFVERI